MQIRMLLGPAGSGKTFRCLREIRGALEASPEGGPLILLAPKQATFQLERQLLAGGLEGYSRLRIVSFQRLARFVFETFGAPLPRLLSAEGRVMVLRAVLNKADLTIFGASARRLGFAEEADGQLREFQQHGLKPDDLRELAREQRGATKQKLEDLAVIYEAFLGWLKRNELRDEEDLLTMAADLLEAKAGALRAGGLWFDGFAQLTPQERRLLGAIAGESERSTLAFCLEKPSESAFSPWFLVSQTYARCRAELETRFGKEAVTVEWLERREGEEGRFAAGSALAHLERHWGSGTAFEGPVTAVRVVECPDPEGEVIACAREIVKLARAGVRYRETAVLTRSFSNEYPELVRRVFARYRIPVFLDHRERVAHHPLAELTRGAMRIAVFRWKHADCFRAFKTGLLDVKREILFELENHALEHGWEGEAWLNGFRLPKSPEREPFVNEARERLAAPFAHFADRVADGLTGVQLAAAVRGLWRGLDVETQLEEWSRRKDESLHETVWEQMNQWLDNLELAFARQTLSAREWLPILEAGLDGLTVGVVPPVLDQVLAGTVDRSRNPDLKAIFVLGLNEGVFPAVPPHRPLLTEQDRTGMLASGIELANLPALQMAQEQFYGYIACTRAREEVMLTCARADRQGRALNPSRFLGQVRRIFPAVAVESGGKPADLAEVEHACELSAIGPGAIPENLRRHVRTLPRPDPEETLSAEEARSLYGEKLEVSVVALERFASCQYRFFIEYGLRVRERTEFALDIREQGTFQHEVLARYHTEVRGMGKQWRDLTAPEARALIGKVADELMETFREGLLVRNEQNRFTGENYKLALQNFIAMTTEWFQTNRFDPAEVELPFGRESGLPAWELELENGCKLALGGRVDRVDLLREADGSGLCLVMDYKSGKQKPEPLLIQHGIQQQLPAYLLALTRVPEIKARLGVTELRAAGCFYVPLGARYEGEKNRNEVLANLEEARRGAYTHRGLFDVAQVASLDSAVNENGSSQFDYRLTNSGVPHKRSFSALESAKFQDLLTLLESNARKFASSIYEGSIDIRPYRKGKSPSSETGCKHCKNQPICRFDPWEQDYHVLRAEGAKAEAT